MIVDLWHSNIYMRSIEQLQFWTLLIGSNTILNWERLDPGYSNRSMVPLRLGLLVLSNIADEVDGQYQSQRTLLIVFF